MLISAFGIAFCGSGITSAANAAEVNCGSGQTIGAAVAKLKPAAGYQTINVKGACTENVFIPQGLAVSIVGSKGASLAPSTGSVTVTVQGKVSVSGLAVTTGSFTAFNVQNGVVTLVADTVSGAGVGVYATNNSTLIAQNVAINVGGFAAIAIYSGSSLEVDGVTPVDGASGTSLTGAYTAIGCYVGSVTLNALGGPITMINSGGDGISLNGCNFTDNVTSGQSISVTNSGGNGIKATGGLLTLTDMNISNSAGIGLFVVGGGSAFISGGMVITGNGSNAIDAQQNGVVSIFNFGGGVNTVSEASGNSNVLFGCYQGGKIYVPQISGYITPAPTQSNIGCLQVGGP
jgi:hypothetical protein